MRVELTAREKKFFQANPFLIGRRVLRGQTCRKCQAELAKEKTRCGYCNNRFEIIVVSAVSA